MHWWLIITLIITGALACGFWNHNRERRHFAKRFNLLAAECQGEVKPGSWLVLPQLRFEIDNRRYLVAALATAGNDTGNSGPITLVDLVLPFDTGQKIRVRRRGVANRLIGAIAPGWLQTTNHKEFDEAFQIEGSNEAVASGLLAMPVRQKLLASRMPRLDVRLDGARISVHMDGIVKTKVELEELINTADLVAKHCAARL